MDFYTDLAVMYPEKGLVLLVSAFVITSYILFAVDLIKAKKEHRKVKLGFKFTIDDGSGVDRTICSGIAAFYENPEELIGKRILFVANFAPRTMMGIESQGMILSAVDADESLSVVTTTKDVKPGSQVG